MGNVTLAMLRLCIVVLVVAALAAADRVVPFEDIASREDREVQAVLNMEMPAPSARDDVDLGESDQVSKSEKASTAKLKAKQQALEAKMKKASAKQAAASAAAQAKNTQKQEIRQAALKAVDAQAAAADNVKLQAKMKASKVPSSAEERVNQMESFSDDIAKMQASLTKAETETDEAANSAEGPTFKQEVAGALKKVDVSAAVQKQAAQAKLTNKMRYLEQKAAIEREKAQIKEQIKQIAHQRKANKMKNTVQAQIERDQEKAAVQKAQDQEDAKKAEAAAKAKLKAKERAVASAGRAEDAKAETLKQ